MTVPGSPSLERCRRQLFLTFSTASLSGAHKVTSLNVARYRTINRAGRFVR